MDCYTYYLAVTLWMDVIGYSPPHARVVCAIVLGSCPHDIVSCHITSCCPVYYSCSGGVCLCVKKKARSQQPGFSARKKKGGKCVWLLWVCLSLSLVCCVAECADHYHPSHQGLSIPRRVYQQHPLYSTPYVFMLGLSCQC